MGEGHPYRRRRHRASRLSDSSTARIRTAKAPTGLNYRARRVARRSSVAVPADNDRRAFPPCEAALAPDSKTWSTATYDSTRFCRYTKVSATPELLAWPLSGSPGPLLQRAAQASWTCAPDESGRQTPGSVEEEQSRHALLPLVRSESLRGAAGDARICTGAVSRWGWVYGRPSSLLDLSAQRGSCSGRARRWDAVRSVVARAATDESEALCLSIREQGPRWQLPRSMFAPRAGLPAVRSPDIGGTKDVY